MLQNCYLFVTKLLRFKGG